MQLPFSLLLFSLFLFPFFLFSLLFFPFLLFPFFWRGWRAATHAGRAQRAASPAREGCCGRWEQQSGGTCLVALGPAGVAVDPPLLLSSPCSFVLGPNLQEFLGLEDALRIIRESMESYEEVRCAVLRCAALPGPCSCKDCIP